MRISYWSSDVCSSDLHVEALDPVNVLVNYWWNDSGDVAQAPWDAMLHEILAIRQLTPGQRRAWRANFDNSVFLASRSEERSVGKECVRRCRSQWSAYLKKEIKKTTQVLLRNIK